MTKIKARKTYSIIFAVASLLLGLGFILVFNLIYHNGLDYPYSTETIGNGLIKLLAPSILWVLMVIGAFVFDLMVPVTEKPVKAYDNTSILSLMKKKLPADYDKAESELVNSYKHQVLIRRIVLAITIVVEVTIATIIAFYLLDKANFPVPAPGKTVDVMEDAKTMAISILPFIAGQFLMAFLCYYHFEYSSKKMIKIVSGILKEQGTSTPIIKNNDLMILIIRCVVFVTAITFIILGSINGGADDVMNKACKICTECIGIG